MKTMKKLMVWLMMICSLNLPGEQVYAQTFGQQLDRFISSDSIDQSIRWLQQPASTGFVCACMVAGGLIVYNQNIINLKNHIVDGNDALHTRINNIEEAIEDIEDDIDDAIQNYLYDNDYIHGRINNIEDYLNHQSTDHNDNQNADKKKKPVKRIDTSQLEVSLKIFYEGDIKTTFKDVAGNSRAKADLVDIINYLKDPTKYNAIGAKYPKGTLLIGDPGNGKTLLAKAVAGQTSVPFISVSGSSFDDMYIGVGARRVRELFKVARQLAPCIIFIDEIDALLPKRSESPLNIQTINAFLAEMDGLNDENEAAIIVMGATNRLDHVDRAAVRPGRFDRKITVEKPRLLDRIQLLEINFKKVLHDTNVDIVAIADMTSGFSGAELASLVNEAAIMAVNDNCTKVYMKHMLQAFDKVKKAMFKNVDASFNIDIFYPGDIKTKFKDVAGLAKAKADMFDVVDSLKNSKKYHDMGAHAPKGVLMYGPPGNGKTLLARAVAGEADVPFISINGSAFVDRFVGVGAERIRELFEKARQEAPCIIFIDEIDALVKKRVDTSNDSLGGATEHNQTINAFLAEMDGLSKSGEAVIVIGATNRLDALDRAAIRPGRFDRKVYVDKPLLNDRIELLQINFKRVLHDNNLDIKSIAMMTAGFSGAELENLVNEAAILTVRDNCDCVGIKQVQEAFNDIKERILKTVDASFAIDIFYPGDMKVTFDDVAGLAGAKIDMQDVIDYLKDPVKYSTMGAKVVKGVLMNGGPGNGKTLLARAVAGQAGVPFLSISGSSFADKYVGVGADRVREIFEKARKEAPCIVFIDEIDALLGKRSEVGNSEQAQMVNAFLTEMDGLNQSKAPVIVLGATNRVHALDSAAIRPGRFDRVIEINAPHIKDRVELLQIALRKVKSQDIDVQSIAAVTRGFSGAKLANLINEAAYVAINDNSDVILMKHIEMAFDNITLGRINKGLEQSKEALWKTALHEAGHIIGFIFQDKTMRAHKVSIEPRDKTLGVAHWLPLYESYEYTESSMKNQIIALLAGRFAEEEFGLGLSSGASNDIERARKIAYDMVVVYGMSPDLPDLSYSNFMGNLPNDIATKVHQAIDKIIEECRQITRKLIADHKDQIQKIAELLMEKGTVFGSEIYQLLNIDMPESIELDCVPAY